MKSCNKWADVTAMADLITAITLLGMSPVLLGEVSGAGIIALIPWMLPAMILFFFIVVMQFRSNDMIGGTASALLTFMALFQNMIKAFIEMYCLGKGVEVPDTVRQGMQQIDAIILLSMSIIFLAIVYVVGRLSKTKAAFLLMPCTGFILFGGSGLGLFKLQGIAAWLMIGFGIWKLWEGMCGIASFLKEK